MNAIKWPDKEDFKGAIQGLLRVQYTYLLQIEELAKGIDIKPNKKARLIVCSSNFSLENSDKIGFDFICIKFKKSSTKGPFVRSVNLKDTSYRL